MSSRWRDPRRKAPRHPGSGRVELQRRRLAPPSKWTIRDKLSVGAGALVAILAFLSPIILKAVGQRGRISQRVESWRTEYGLHDDQVKKLREIEFAFHGSGNPFSEREPSTAEIERHDKQVVSAMGPEAGKRYSEKIAGTRH